MKIRKLPYQLLILAILFGSIPGQLSAQTPFDESYQEVAAQIVEQVHLFTDRSLYAVDENINFVANLSISGLAEENLWSSVLYVELMATTGKPVAQGKYLLTDGRTEGTLHIPSEVLTGDYYLRSYTRWMRNSGPERFSYNALKIINPFRPEVSLHSEAEGPPVTFRKDSGQKGVLECITASEVYHSGEEVSLQLKSAPVNLPDGLSCCVTVVPEGAINFLQLHHAESSAGDVQPPFRVNFLPDLGSGVSISGTVVDPDQNLVPYATLHFSLLGEVPDFFATMSDENGRFILATSAVAGEKKEFFVTPEQEEGRGLEVRIDQEYDSRTVAFPVENFQLAGDELEVARKIALQMQLSKAYLPDNTIFAKPATTVYSEGSRIPFYGTRVKRLLIDDYVRLPNLEEVFINLVPEVQFYRKRGKKRIKIVSDNNSIGVFSPLIMIDHISVFDHEGLLALSPEKIERIDLINEVYLKGNVSFGGVLAIYSRKGDMAGIDLPKGSYFFDYQSFNPPAGGSIQPPAPDTRVPDTRNTIFWSGYQLLEKGSQVEIPFTAPTSPGNYVILLRGVSRNGEVFSASSTFRVE
jgi:hypothetical protein